MRLLSAPLVAGNQQIVTSTSHRTLNITGLRLRDDQLDSRNWLSNPNSKSLQNLHRLTYQVHCLTFLVDGCRWTKSQNSCHKLFVANRLAGVLSFFDTLQDQFHPPFATAKVPKGEFKNTNGPHQPLASSVNRCSRGGGLYFLAFVMVSMEITQQVNIINWYLNNRWYNYRIYLPLPGTNIYPTFGKGKVIIFKSAFSAGYVGFQEGI